MEIIEDVIRIQKYADQVRGSGRTIGFIPTMGYLHQGHLSLVRTARSECDEVVVSIFVNPSQFGPGEDFSTYPRNIERDAALLKDEKADVIFYPSVNQMYPEPSLTTIFVNKLSAGLCGAIRPGHFEGVALVVAKLFNIVKPHKAYFGNKDFQQQVVIRRMVADLNFDIEIVGCPIVRDPDGLALSSRNKYLSQDERDRALVLNKSLIEAQEMIEAGERKAEKIVSVIREMVEGRNPSKIDYISIVSPDSLEPVERIASDVLVALAVRFGKTRLIDNRLCRVSNDDA